MNNNNTLRENWNTDAKIEILLHRYLWLKIHCIHKSVHTSNVFHINFRYLVLHIMFFLVLVRQVLLESTFSFRLWVDFSSFQKQIIVRVSYRIYTVHFYCIYSNEGYETYVNMTNIFTVSVIFPFYSIVILGMLWECENIYFYD